MSFTYKASFMCGAKVYDKVKEVIDRSCIINADLYKDKDGFYIVYIKELDSLAKPSIDAVLREFDEADESSFEEACYGCFIGEDGYGNEFWNDPGSNIVGPHLEIALPEGFKRVCSMKMDESISYKVVVIFGGMEDYYTVKTGLTLKEAIEEILHPSRLWNILDKDPVWQIKSEEFPEDYDVFGVYEDNVDDCRAHEAKRVVWRDYNVSQSGSDLPKEDPRYQVVETIMGWKGSSLVKECAEELEKEDTAKMSGV